MGSSKATIAIRLNTCKILKFESQTIGNANNHIDIVTQTLPRNSEESRKTIEPQRPGNSSGPR